MFIPFIFSLATVLFPAPEATLVFAGDAMQHQAQIDAGRQSDGSYDYSSSFKALSQYISEADYAVVNLETPVADAHLSGYPCFNAPPQFLDALKDAGFNMFLTANNHTLDRRDAGLKSTIARLDARNVDHIGTYINPQERAKSIPFIKDINSFKVGFLNYTYGTNGIGIQGNAVVDYIDKNQMSTDIAATRNAGAEIIVVAIHWGDEYKLLPNANQKSLANFLLDQGVDLIIGSHPHVIQPAEIRHNPKTGRKSLIVYSLGNFISNMKTTDTRGGMVIQTVLTRDENGKAQLDNASYRLIFTLTPDSRDSNFRVIPIDSETDINDKAGVKASQCKAFITSALRILNAHNIDVPRQ